MIMERREVKKMATDSVLCRGIEGDQELFRTQVWEDRLWRLTMSQESEVAGFAYLEPKRHIPHITDLDGEEALTFGTTIARVSAALKDETAAELVYVYIFGGGVPHMHVHLAPHREGDALNENMIKGELIEKHLPNGASLIQSKDYSPLPVETQQVIADHVRARLKGWADDDRSITHHMDR
jgi:diadenosine tetraphosphate (Ap4A) HIT family hydrolase